MRVWGRGMGAKFHWEMNLSRPWMEAIFLRAARSGAVTRWWRVGSGQFVQEDGEDAPAVVVDEGFDGFKVGLVLRVRIAERDDDEADASLGCALKREVAHIADKLPEAGGAEVKEGFGDVDGGVVVEEASGDFFEEGFGDGEFSAGWRAVEEEKIHGRPWGEMRGSGDFVGGLEEGMRSDHARC